MIILDSTRSLEALLSGSVSTAQLPLVASYQDLSTGQQTYLENQTTTNNTTAVSFVSACAGGLPAITRQISFLSAYNGDSASATLTLRINSSGTYRTLLKATLSVSDSLLYDETGFRVIDSAGNIKTSATGSGGSGDVVGPGSSTDNAITRFDGTTGKLIQNSSASVSDVGNITAANLSGTNTGDQTISLTGDVTGSGTGSFAATIANDAVTLAKMANMATASLLGRTSVSTGDPEVLSVSTSKTLLNLSGTNSGDATLSGENYLSLTGQAFTANAVALGGTNVSGTLTVAKGGTGQTSASSAINALLPTQTSNSGKFLTTNGTASSWATVSGGSGVHFTYTLKDFNEGVPTAGQMAIGSVGIEALAFYEVDGNGYMLYDLLGKCQAGTVFTLINADGDESTVRVIYHVTYPYYSGNSWIFALEALPTGLAFDDVCTVFISPAPLLSGMNNDAATFQSASQVSAYVAGRAVSLFTNDVGYQTSSNVSTYVTGLNVSTFANDASYTTLAAVGGSFQPLDSDLTALAGVTPFADGTYTVGIGGSTNGTITISHGLITGVVEAS